MEKILEKIRLAEGVELIPVREVNDLPEMKDIAFEPDDFILNKPRSRHRSKLVTPTMAELLRYFEEPTTIVDAIMSYATAVKQEPTPLLEEAYPFIMDLIRQDLLVFKWDTSEENILKPSDKIDEYVVTKVIQKLEDTRVFEAVSEETDRPDVIIKLLVAISGEKKMQFALENEKAILAKLSNTINPRLVRDGEYHEHSYLMLEKITNTPLLEYTKKMRERSDFTGLVSVFKKIILAYQQLNAEGVYHIDINPRNILVTPEEKVFIIDFGLSCFTDAAYSTLPGVDHFSPPEMVAMVENKVTPKWTAQAEQYSLFALLYYLLTGKHYLNFSSSREDMKKQLLEELPIAFDEQGLSLPKAFEDIFQKALQKDPVSRYKNFEEALTAFDKLELSSFPTIIKQERIFDNPELYANTDELIDALSIEKNIRGYFQKGPSCSIFCGGAGIAYFLYRLSLQKQSPQLIALAEVWSQYTREAMKDENAFINRDMGFTEKDVDSVSVFNHEPGLHFVRAMIGNATGDAACTMQSIERLLTLSNIETDNIDMTMGKLSILLALAQILETMPVFYQVDRSRLIQFGNAYLQKIWQADSLQKSITEDYTIKYTGIAHGWAGFIYAALRWYQATNTPIPAWVESKLDEFIAVREEQEGLITWKSKINTRYFHYTPGWCNGSAGFLQLFSTAGNLLQKDSYTAIAEKIAVDVYGNPTHEPSLCCGLTGRSYALLNLYKTTGNEMYHDQASSLLDRAKDINTFLKIDSLYKGKFGVKLLEEEIGNAREIVFPCL